MAVHNPAPGMTFAGFLIIAALGSVIWSSYEPDSSRPPGSSENTAVNLVEDEIPARLWQDPYLALYKFHKKEPKKSEIIYSQVLTKFLDEKPVSGVKEIIEETKHLYYSNPKHPLHIRIKNQTEKNSLTVLGIMVDTDPYAEFAERRRQRRYAVVSALGETGYVPDNSKLIHALHLKDMPVKGEDMILPYEWYTHEESPDNTPCVLVVWLDEAKFSSRPWEVLSQFAEIIINTRSNPKNITFKILGPSSSTTLKEMKQNLKKIKDLKFGGLHILSPIATMADDLLGLPDGGLAKIIKTNNYESEDISFIRTIRTDDVLAKELVDELEKRIISDDKNKHSLSNGTIVLISEWDTSFGRSLPRSFMQKFCGNKDKCARVVQYSYLRGVDGRAPGTQDLGRKTSARNDEKAGYDFLNGNAHSMRRPVGTGQHDYLQRIAENIEHLDRERYKKYGKGIVAIGVLGSDVYDKLMILKILHSKLHSSVLFTTDLDSQLLHPSDYDLTRNVIVASSFNLKLPDKLQGKIPPFRNNYQTSMFFSTLLAIKYKCPGTKCKIKPFDQKAINKAIQPVISEIGRHGIMVFNGHDKKTVACLKPIKVGNSTEDICVVEKSKHEDNGYSQVYLIGFIVVLVIAALLLLSHKWEKSRWWLFSGLFFVLASLLVPLGYGGYKTESFSLINGTSVWPSYYIWIFTIGLTLVFIRRVIESLDENRNEMSKKYFEIDDSVVSWSSNIARCQEKNIEYLREKPGWLKVTWETLFFGLTKTRLMGIFFEAKKWWVKYVVLGSLFGAGVIGMMMLSNSASISNFYLLAGFIVLALILWCVIVFFGFNLRTINFWKMELRKNEGEIEINMLWKEYEGYDVLFHRMLRVLSNVLFYVAIVLTIYLLLGKALPPVRGEINIWLINFIMVISAIGMWFIIFFVGDATRLCTTWISALPGKEINWEKSKWKKFGKTLNMNEDVTILWMKMRMIAERTQVVGELIYLPFIIIVLMLLARISYFDHWGFPQALAIVVVANIAIATSAGFRLKSAAERARSKILKDLNERYICALGYKLSVEKSTRISPPNQIKAMIENIENIREGAYKPFLEQPVVRAFILLLGGVGFSISQYSNVLG